MGPVIDSRREGKLTLLLRSGLTKPAALRIRYLRSDGGLEYQVLGKSPSQPLRLIGPSRRPIVVGAGTIFRLVFAATLPASARLNALDGTLVVALQPLPPPAKPPRGFAGEKAETLPPTTAARPRSPSRSLAAIRPARLAPPVADTADGRLLVGVKGAERMLNAVAIMPDKIALRLTRTSPWFGAGTATAHVRIIGADTRAFHGEQAAFARTVVLRDGNGREAQVSLSDLHADGDALDATLKLAGEPPPGEYSGPLVLASHTPAAKLTVTVRSRHSVWAAIVAVLLGVILGGALPVFYGRHRRKTLLHAELKQSLAEYKQARDDPNAPPQHWSLDRAIGPEPWTRHQWFALPRLHGAGGLWSAIEWARASDELDELSTQVLDLSGRIERWLMLNPLIRELSNTLETVTPNPRSSGTRWEDTETRLDSYLLLATAKETEPEKDDDAEALARRAIRQEKWHRRVAELWTEVAAAEDDDTLSQAQRTRIAAIDFTTVAAPREAARKEEDWLALSEKLELLTLELERCKNIDLENEPDGALEDWVSANAGRAYDAAIAFVRSIAAPAGAARAGAKLGSWKNALSLRKTGLEDLALTLLAVLAAATVYALTVYNETWGSTIDYLTAISAGFGTQVVIKWAALPAFQALRPQRKPPAQPPAQPPPDDRAPEETGDGEPAPTGKTPEAGPAGSAPPAQGAGQKPKRRTRTAPAGA